MPKGRGTSLGDKYRTRARYYQQGLLIDLTLPQALLQPSNVPNLQPADYVRISQFSPII
jgi:hypothetical protein